VFSIPEGAMMSEKCVACVTVLAIASVACSQQAPEEPALPKGALAKLRAPIKNFGAVAITMSRDGKLLAAFGFNKELVIWNLETKKVKTTATMPESVRLGSFSPDGKYLATATSPPVIQKYATDPLPVSHCHLWDVTTGEIVRDFWPDGIPAPSLRS